MVQWIKLVQTQWDNILLNTCLGHLNLQEDKNIYGKVSKYGELPVWEI